MQYRILLRGKWFLQGIGRRYLLPLNLIQLDMSYICLQVQCYLALQGKARRVLLILKFLQVCMVYRSLLVGMMILLGIWRILMDWMCLRVLMDMGNRKKHRRGM